MRAAVIGLGWWGKQIIECLSNSKKINITHGVDPYADQSSDFFIKHNVDAVFGSRMMKKGDALFLTKKTVHSALPNISDVIRWSFDLRYQPIGQPTGRDIFPGFVARSLENPEQILKDAETWNDQWHSTREKLSKEEQFAFNRWDGDDIACA